jgi:hypothetical protein
LPIWAKLSLFIFFVSLIAIVGGLGVGAAWIAKFPIAARDPVEMGKVVRRFGEIENPLPQGFKYEYAFSVPLLANQVIIIEHTPDRSLFWLLRIPNPSKQSSDALLQQWAKRNPINGREFETKEKGTEQVGGQKMAYVIGTSGNVQEMIGTLPSSRSERESILFMGMNAGPAYNVDTTRQLLGAIKAL